jgi:hypothetical protein
VGRAARRRPRGGVPLSPARREVFVMMQLDLDETRGAWSGPGQE